MAPLDPDVRGFFDGHRTLPAIVEAVLEGRQGRAERDGGAARLSLGCYEVYGGDAASAGARRLVAGARPSCELVYGNQPAWRRLIQDVHGARVVDRPMVEFEVDHLDPARLRELAVAPAGFELMRMDAAMAAQMDRELEPHALQVYPSATDFVASGLGYAAVAGPRVACAATSYTLSSRHLEVAIATRPEFRGHGLAAAASAALMLQALENGLVPCWSASNPVSQRLAQRLGYRPGGTCEVLLLVG
jgi:GNAT superfamily N-acetyltransferase